jgi:thiol-disulfide isomerase/thioredoxin
MSRTLVLASFLLAACATDSDTPSADAILDTTDLAEVSDGGTASDTETDLSLDLPDSTPEPPPLPDAIPDGTPDLMAQDTMTTDVAADSVDSASAPETSDEPWPNNPDKDQIPDPGWDSTPGVGTVMPNFAAVDQYGNLVELYDLAMEGKPIVLDVGTWFCEPCKSLAWYLSTGETGECPYADTILEDLGWWNEEYEIVKNLVDTGAIRWVSILYSLGTPVTAQDAAAWHEAFPHEQIVVLADTTLQLQEYLEVAAMPRIDLLDEQMTFLIYHPGGPNKGLQKLVSLYAP